MSMSTETLKWGLFGVAVGLWIVNWKAGIVLRGVSSKLSNLSMMRRLPYMVPSARGQFTQVRAGSGELVGSRY